MKPHSAAAFFAALALLAGCQRPVEKMVEVSGRLFVFNYRVATATYLVTLRKTGPIPAGAIAIAEFEDPAGGNALVLREAIRPSDDKIVLQSPNIRCVRKDRPYAVAIRIVDAEGTSLQDLQTVLVSDVDQVAVLPTKPLVVGPLYQKNPDVFKSDGSTDYGKDLCPAP